MLLLTPPLEVLPVEKNTAGRSVHCMQPGPRVLIAEDEDSEIFLYERALREIGITNVEFVRNGEQAVEYLKGLGKYSDRETHPFPAWLLLDLNMPRMTGLEVLDWVRHKPCCKVVPTVIFSNSAQVEDITAAYDLGANAYFTKPTKFEEMISVVALIAHFWSVAKRTPIDPHLKCK